MALRCLPPEGTTYGLYRLENTLISRGHFSTIVLCEHMLLGIKTAMKIVDISKIKPRSLRECFTRECKIMLHLKHPRIITYYESFWHDNLFCTTLSHVPNGSLWRLISKQPNKRIGECMGRKITQDLVSGLIYLDEMKIIHQNLNLDNILLDKDMQALITNFDMCIHKMERKSNFVRICPLEYAAPELLGFEEYDNSVDIWSLGIIIYRMIMGHFPFNSDYTTCDSERLRRQKHFLKVIRGLTIDHVNDMHNQLSQRCRITIQRLLEPNHHKRITISQLQACTFISMSVHNWNDLIKKNLPIPISVELFSRAYASRVLKRILDEDDEIAKKIKVDQLKPMTLITQEQIKCNNFSGSLSDISFMDIKNVMNAPVKDWIALIKSNKSDDLMYNNFKEKKEDTRPLTEIHLSFEENMKKPETKLYTVIQTPSLEEITFFSFGPRHRDYFSNKVCFMRNYTIDPAKKSLKDIIKAQRENAKKKANSKKAKHESELTSVLLKNPPHNKLRNPVNKEFETTIKIAEQYYFKLGQHYYSSFNNRERRSRINKANGEKHIKTQKMKNIKGAKDSKIEILTDTKKQLLDMFSKDPKERNRTDTNKQPSTKENENVHIDPEAVNNSELKKQLNNKEFTTLEGKKEFIPTTVAATNEHHKNANSTSSKNYEKVKYYYQNYKDQLQRDKKDIKSAVALPKTNLTRSEQHNVATKSSQEDSVAVRHRRKLEKQRHYNQRFNTPQSESNINAWNSIYALPSKPESIIVSRTDRLMTNLYSRSSHKSRRYSSYQSREFAPSTPRRTDTDRNRFSLYKRGRKPMDKNHYMTVQQKESSIPEEEKQKTSIVIRSLFKESRETRLNSSTMDSLKKRELRRKEKSGKNNEESFDAEEVRSNHYSKTKVNNEDQTLSQVFDDRTGQENKTNATTNYMSTNSLIKLGIELKTCQESKLSSQLLNLKTLIQEKAHKKTELNVSAVKCKKESDTIVKRDKTTFTSHKMASSGKSSRRFSLNSRKIDHTDSINSTLNSLEIPSNVLNSILLPVKDEKINKHTKNNKSHVRRRERRRSHQKPAVDLSKQKESDQFKPSIAHHSEKSSDRSMTPKLVKRSEEYTRKHSTTIETSSITGLSSVDNDQQDLDHGNIDKLCVLKNPNTDQIESIQESSTIQEETRHSNPKLEGNQNELIYEKYQRQRAQIKLAIKEQENKIGSDASHLTQSEETNLTFVSEISKKTFKVSPKGLQNQDKRKRAKF